MKKTLTQQESDIRYNKAKMKLETEEENRKIRKVLLVIGIYFLIFAVLDFSTLANDIKTYGISSTIQLIQTLFVYSSFAIAGTALIIPSIKARIKKNTSSEISEKSEKSLNQQEKELRDEKIKLELDTKKNNQKASKLLSVVGSIFLIISVLYFSTFKDIENSFEFNQAMFIASAYGIMGLVFLVISIKIQKK